LLPVGSEAPYEVSIRSAAAVDRITGYAEQHRTACLEFAPGAGWWGLIDIVQSGDIDWEARVKSALRVLADSGFGGERSRGWGRAHEPQFTDASGLFKSEGHANAWWLLSIYSPHTDDAVDWTKGDYSTTTRAGWTDSPAGSLKKKQVRMIEEGSVLIAPAIKGRAVDAAPDGFAHPVWRSGIAFAVPVPIEVEV
jgi:CRISPR type III-A-associated RAMP protein Csm4